MYNYLLHLIVMELAFRYADLIVFYLIDQTMLPVNATGPETFILEFQGFWFSNS